MESMIKLIVKNCVLYIKKRHVDIDKSVSNLYLLRLAFKFTFCYLRGLIKAKKFVSVGARSRIYSLSNIKISQGVTIGDNVLLDGLSVDGVHLGKNFSIGSNSIIKASGTLTSIGKGISIGDNVGIGEFAYIGGAGGVSIGDDTIVGQYLSIHSEDHQFSDPSQLIRLQGVKRQGIEIGSNCWIGAKVTFCDGSAIGYGCVVAAGSVVTKKFDDHCLIGGVPAKVIRKIGNE